MFCNNYFKRIEIIESLDEEIAFIFSKYLFLANSPTKRIVILTVNEPSLFEDSAESTPLHFVRFQLFLINDR